MTTVFLDMDGVLADFHRVFLKKYPEVFGHGSLARFLEHDKEKFVQKLFEFVEAGEMLRLPRIQGSQEAANRLDRISSYIVVLTCRPKVAELDTVNWLRANSYPYDEVVVIEDIRMKGTEKSAYINSISEPSILVDDQPNIIRHVAKECPKCTVMVLAQPYNDITLPEGVRRYGSWEDIGRAIGGRLG